ncbi:helix-turn-helix transcriptional regulator [Hymenobacter sp. BT664]|uniref:Helix-turn-helix transcriptional regulator n=1 Tax=Hymenobacter montanus TaxID=2771359 RepID=A0A927BEX6_9BACT|nr:helix-turn-helix transcriptional regulator [Hymenobacter montanus]MBD2769610.1 helix-turn-helix transcriptional regulator [Hymenobacter montanus]
MQPVISVTSLLYLLGSIQALFFASILLADARRNAAKLMLAAFLLAFALVTFNDFLVETRYIFLLPHLAGLFLPFLFLLGPCLWFYIRLLTQPRFQLRARHAWHAVPSLACLAAFFPFYVLDAPAKLGALKQSYAISPSQHLSPFELLAFLHTFGYLLVGVILLRQHQRKVRAVYSNVEKRELRWLSNLLIMSGLLWASWVFNVFDGQEWAEQIDALLCSLTIFLLSFFGVRQARVEVELEGLVLANQGASPIAPRAGRKYERSGLSEEQARAYLVKLTTLMEEEKLYRNGELTLAGLAEQLTISPHYLSQLLNDKKGQSFYDYVNAYRVEEVKAGLADPSKGHLSLLGLALEAGFNSKTAFNTVFKKITGLSPSAYRAQHHPARPTKTAAPIG